MQMWVLQSVMPWGLESSWPRFFTVLLAKNQEDKTNVSPCLTCVHDLINVILETLGMQKNSTLWHCCFVFLARSTASLWTTSRWQNASLCWGTATILSASLWWRWVIVLFPSDLLAGSFTCCCSLIMRELWHCHWSYTTSGYLGPFQIPS